MTAFLRPVGRLGLLLFVVGALAFVQVAFVHIADAQPTTTGPMVSLDRDRFAPNERVVVTIDGFKASYVTITVCGNEARRGSTDCNMTASEGLALDRDGSSTLAQIPFAAPPTPCPCLVRVSSRNNDEIAVVPITLIGHPVAPVIDSPTPESPIVLSLSARVAPTGMLDGLQSNLGGATKYEVTVTVKNRSTVAVRGVTLAGSGGRGSDKFLASFELGDPGAIAPGQTWQQVIQAEVPALTFGEVQWQVVASGAGPAVTSTDVTDFRPMLLFLLVMVLILDLAFLAIRFTMRRRAAREAEAARAASVGNAANGDDSWTDADAAPELVPSR